MRGGTSYKILVVDDQVLFREGVVNLLGGQPDMEVVAEASDGLEALEKSRQLAPDLILMDIRMPNCDGLEATRLIKQEMPDAKVVILTVSDYDDDLFEAIKGGAIGYLLKNLNADELFERIRGVFEGEAALSPVLAAKVLEEFARQGQKDGNKAENGGLTDREREVLELVMEGLSNRDIGVRLSITESTVKRHLHNILEKLHLDNRVQAAAYAVKKGWLRQPAGGV